MVGAHLISAVCALGCALATWTHYNLMPPPRLKAPVTTRLAGSLTYLTVQSNWIMTCYHMLRFLLPGNYLAQHAFPLAFALGFNLTLLYYGLNHFVAEKRRMDAEWIGKGWRRIPLGNHLEHGLALPLALLDASAGGHAGESSAYDTLLFVGVYVALYLAFTLLNHRHSGMWIYPIFDKLIEKKGPVGFWLLACPVAVAYISVGFLGQALVG